MKKAIVKGTIMKTRKLAPLLACTTDIRSRTTRVPALVVALFAGALLAACGSDAGDAGGGTTPDASIGGGGDASPGGADAGGGGDAGGGVACETAISPGDPSVFGRFYVDENASDASTYEAAFEAGSDSPMAGISLAIIGPEGRQDTATCADGTYSFGPLTDGIYVMAPEYPDRDICSQHNCARRFPDAVWEGSVKIVTFGDSVPVIGADETFPERLADLIRGVARVQNRNVAIPGTTSIDWLPGTQAFEQDLVPELDGADVVIVSLGGNDILRYAQGFASDPSALGNIDEAVDGAFELVEEIVENLLMMKDEIRRHNADADIVYVLYPNYGQATNDQLWSLANAFLGEDTIRELLSSARSGVPADEDMILVDMFGAMEGLPLDDYLYDQLHFNELGQDIYAQEIFKALGGVLTGSNPLPSGESPLGLEKNYSFGP